MRDTIIVFSGIGILLLLPLFFYGLRFILKSRKEKNFKYLYYKLAGLGLASIIVIVLVLGICRFTLGYQAPLVAETFLESEGYRELRELGWDIESSSIYLGENIYENEDDTVTIYVQFEKNGQSRFTSIDMEKSGDKWNVISHNIITGDYKEHSETQKRFYPIKR